MNKKVFTLNTKDNLNVNRNITPTVYDYVYVHWGNRDFSFSENNFFSSYGTKPFFYEEVGN
jgi:hypothetical protein